MPDNEDYTKYTDDQLQDRYTDLLVLQKEYVTHGDTVPDWLKVAMGEVFEEIEHRGLD